MWIVLAICGGIALSATVHLLWKARYEALKADYDKSEAEYLVQLKATRYTLSLERGSRLDTQAELNACKGNREETVEQLLKVTEELNALKAPKPTKGGF